MLSIICCHSGIWSHNVYNVSRWKFEYQQQRSPAHHFNTHHITIPITSITHTYSDRKSATNIQQSISDPPLQLHLPSHLATLSHC